MPRQGRDNDPKVVPLRGSQPRAAAPTGDGPRRSRISEARRYQPRARTLREEVPVRPALRLVESTKPATPVQRKPSPTQTKTPTKTQTKTKITAAKRSTTRVTRRVRRPMRLADPARRLRLGTVMVLLLFTVIGVRLIQFQVTEAGAYASEGLESRLQPVGLPAPRGSIVDRDGAVLAQSVEARFVFADPEFVENPLKTADALSPVIGIPRSELIPKLVPHRRADGTVVRFEYLRRGVDIATGDQVRRLNLAGIGVQRDERRVVPGHDLAANLIGFTGRDLTGLAGLEAGYDELLRGVDGLRVFEIGQQHGTSNLDHQIPGGYLKETPARPGRTLQLTIDRDLQFEAQGILGASMQKAHATFGSAIVLDVHTGEVLAQASYPFYDAANPLAYKPEMRGDAATGIPVDPGSVHKAVVMAAALQEGVISPGTTIPVTPTVTKGDTTFRDTHWQEKPVMTIPGILAYSSNVGTIGVADRLGAQKLYEYQRAFGLGSPTGEGLPGESAGLVQPPQNWSGSSFGSIPIGLGVSVTALQMAAVYGTIANDGVYVRPTLVKGTLAPDGTATPAAAAPTRRVMSPENAAALRTMLEAVVTVPDATGTSAALEGYRVAGKTGTGSLVKDGHYAPGEVASFVGMAPAEHPRYVVAVFAYTPGGNGGAVAGPAFRNLMAFTLLHYRVPPTGTKPPKFHVYG